VVGGSVKWLLGGPGTGYLYARPEVAAGLAPRLVGWFGHQAPFAFEPSPIAFAAGAGRFVTGTPNVAAHVMAAEGYRIVAEAGVDAIRAKSRRQVARLLDGFQAQGAVVRGPADPPRRGGSVVVDFDGAEQVTAELIARGYTCDYRPGRPAPRPPPLHHRRRVRRRGRRGRPPSAAPGLEAGHLLAALDGSRAGAVAGLAVVGGAGLAGAWCRGGGTP
jgi:kynureninase